MPRNQLPAATPEQRKAWTFYGMPRNVQATKGSTVTAVGADQQVGEVRYVIGWIADQMVRMGWRVTIGGSETWTLTLSDGDTVISDAGTSDLSKDQHPVKASQRLLEVIMWNTRTVREVTTNLFVAGELHYVLDSDRWRVVSVVRSDRDEIINRASLKVRGVWPHPADPEAADAPLFGVLGVLDDMLWLNRLSRSQSANRVGMRGIVGVADGMSTAQGGSGESFWQDFEQSLSRSMDSPEDVSPVGLVGPPELVKPEGNGMGGLSWVIPDFPYDDKIDKRMTALVQRLAYGLPIPPEILLGMQAQSKATAFQVEGSTYRAHIEPVALLVAQIATDALSKFLPDGTGAVEVVPDPTTILARRHSVADVLDAFDRGAVGFEYLREVLGIPERAAVVEDDIELKQLWSGKADALDSVVDPANEAASEPISAAASMPSDSLSAAAPQSADDEYLADLLHRIDMAALHELIGAADQAVVRVRERIGARLRTSPKLKDRIPSSLANEEVLAQLDSDLCMEALGIKGQEIVDAALAPTLAWWDKRLVRAQEQAAAVLEDAGLVPEFNPRSAELSRSALHAYLAEISVAGKPVQDTQLRAVLQIAGGE